jgi:oligoendopeptidase F
MQSFPQFEYKRPDLNDLKKRFETTLNQLQSQTDVDSMLASLREIEVLRVEWDTMNNLSYIRHTIDTSDEFYDAEKEYFSNNHPEFQELETNFFRILPTLPEQETLRAEFGEQLFIIAELMQKLSIPLSSVTLEKRTNYLISSLKLFLRQKFLSVVKPIIFRALGLLKNQKTAKPEKKQHWQSGLSMSPK